MQRWQGLDEVPDDWGRSRGHHRRLRRRAPRPPARSSRRAAEAAAQLGLPVVVVTFDPHPDEVVRPGSHPPFLCTRAAALPSCWPGSASTRSACSRSPTSSPSWARTSSCGPCWWTGCTRRAWWWGRTSGSATGRGRRRAAGRAGREVRLHRRGRAAAGRRRRQDLLDRDPGAARRRATWPARRATWAARTGSRAWSCAASSAAGRSASRPPTWRRCRTPRSRPTASTRAG